MKNSTPQLVKYLLPIDIQVIIGEMVQLHIQHTKFQPVLHDLIGAIVMKKVHCLEHNFTNASRQVHYAGMIDYIHRTTTPWDRDLLMEHLSQCQCCPEHQQRRPTLQNYHDKIAVTYPPSHRCCTTPKQCLCSCRSICRHLCRIQTFQCQPHNHFVVELARNHERRHIKWGDIHFICSHDPSLEDNRSLIY